VKDRSVSQIFGNPDDLKFHSCMTLFSFVEGADPVFRNALAQHFDGAPDLATVERLTGGAKP
jgi:uncharacterized protein (DUF1810 family)